MTVGDQTADEIDQEVDWTAMTGVLNLRESLSSSLCKWSLSGNYIGHRPAKRIAS